jgi:hypothetical protein
MGRASFFLLALFSAATTGFSQVETQPVEIPVVFKGELAAIEALRKSNIEQLAAWNEGDGYFITLEDQKKYGVRARWSGVNYRIEEFSLKPNAKHEEVDWNTVPSLIWIQNGRKHYRYDFVRGRLIIYVDPPRGNLGHTHLQVLPHRRFAHLQFDKPWHELLDPEHAKSFWPCEYFASREDDHIILKCTWDDNGATFSSTTEANAKSNWLVTQREGATASGRFKDSYTFETNDQGKLVPKRLEQWFASNKKPEFGEATHWIEVKQIDFRPQNKARFSLATLVVPPKISVLAMDHDGKVLLQKLKATSNDFEGIERELDAHIDKSPLPR